jgi:hypothetical protein
MVHPDYQYTPLLIPAMVSLIGSGLYDCVLGSRILGGQALAAPAGSAAAVSASLIFALAALGAIEHLFFALPFRDGALWGWALPARNNRINA